MLGTRDTEMSNTEPLAARMPLSVWRDKHVRVPEIQRTLWEGRRGIFKSYPGMGTVGLKKVSRETKIKLGCAV